jgi:hypothetical protein
MVGGGLRVEEFSDLISQSASMAFGTGSIFSSRGSSRRLTRLRSPRGFSAEVASPQLDSHKQRYDPCHAMPSIPIIGQGVVGLVQQGQFPSFCIRHAQYPGYVH